MLAKRIYGRIAAVHPELPKYLLALALMGICSGIFENTYNNWLYAQFQVSPTTRGHLEFVREFPGLITAPLMGAFSFLPETTVAALSALVTAVGMAGLALKGDVWWLMLVFTVLWGIGTHLIMPLNSSLTMELGGQTQRGKRLGQVGAVSIAGAITGAAVVWLVFSNGGPRPEPGGAMAVVESWRFDFAFLLAAAVCVGAALCFRALKAVGAHSKRPTLVLKGKYWLYYVLNILFGARKQVFLTFGRWVLVTIFSQSPTTFAKLSIAASLIGIWFTPLAGRLIDRLGERTVLMVDSFVLMVVCLAYGGAEHIGLPRESALYVVYCAYVIDQLFFAVGMARDTYMSKIAETKEDLTASLSVGVSINHVVAMTVPTLGGLLWTAYGYETVFMVAAAMALLMTLFASMIRVPKSVDLAEPA